MKNTLRFYIVFEVLRVLHIKICKMQPLEIFYFLLFYILDFTSGDIIFHKFLELHSTLSEKKIFVANFDFFKGLTQTPLLPPP